MSEEIIIRISVPAEAINGLCVDFPDLKVFDDENDPSEVFVDTTPLGDVGSPSLREFAAHICTKAEKIEYRYVHLVAKLESKGA